MITILDLSKPELQDSYTRLLNHLPGAVYRCEIIFLDKEFSPNYITKLKFASQGIYKLLNITSGELQYEISMLDSMTSDEDVKKAHKTIYQSYIKKEAYQIMYKLNLNDKSSKWIWDQGEVFCENGTFFLEGIIMDFSEYKNYEFALKEENARLQNTLSSLYGFGDIIGKSEPMLKLYEQIKKAGDSTSNVLILGETGTGKELVARSIYDLSKQKGDFIPVNCGAIPDQLLESEFFGYKKGAFSGATQNKDGFIKAAHNGTLFLDEVAELPLNLQVKLLRTLENKQYTPVGSNTPEQSSFRLICATHQNMAEMVKEKLMRSDFFYRINVLPISVPPLRERNGDIPLLINMYLEKNNICSTIPKNIRTAMDKYDWPGNVRELKNFLERYFLLGDSVLDDLPSKVTEEYDDLQECMDTFGLDSSLVTLEENMRAFEEKIILNALEKCRWKQEETAKYLDINVRTLQRKLKLHNIIR